MFTTSLIYQGCGKGNQYNLSINNQNNNKTSQQKGTRFPNKAMAIHYYSLLNNAVPTHGEQQTWGNEIANVRYHN